MDRRPFHRLCNRFGIVNFIGRGADNAQPLMMLMCSAFRKWSPPLFANRQTKRRPMLGAMSQVRQTFSVPSQLNIRVAHLRTRAGETVFSDEECGAGSAAQDKPFEPCWLGFGLKTDILLVAGA
jgi:hypothetical protein